MPCRVFTAAVLRADGAFFFTVVVFLAGAVFFFIAVAFLADAAFFFIAVAFLADAAFFFTVVVFLADAAFFFIAVAFLAGAVFFFSTLRFFATLVSSPGTIKKGSGCPSFLSIRSARGWYPPKECLPGRNRGARGFHGERPVEGDQAGTTPSGGVGARLLSSTSVGDRRSAGLVDGPRYTISP